MNAKQRRTKLRANKKAEFKIKNWQRRLETDPKAKQKLEQLVKMAQANFGITDEFIILEESPDDGVA